MKKVCGIWLPDGDQHFKDQLPHGPVIRGKATYQYRKYAAALKYVRVMDHAVDVGGHVGLWSRVMSYDFNKVTAFEPLEAHRQCFVHNVPNIHNVTLLPYAVGATAGTTKIHMPADNTGHAHVLHEGEECEVVTLDSMTLDRIDFLKIDVEGFEFSVLCGAEETIKRDRPVIIVEQKPDNAERYGQDRYDAVKLLKDWGMREAEIISGDHIMVWP